MASVAPLVVGVVLWAIWDSPFALVGALIGPVMVVAHFFDSRRRHRAQARSEVSAARLTAVAKQRESHAALRTLREDENRRFPSIATIVNTASWHPAFDGSTLVRAGSQTRDGVRGFPWLVDVANGVCVLGVGDAAESVVRSLVVGVSARLGQARSVDSQSWEWPMGIRLSRRDDPLCALTIRCGAESIESVGRRGELPDSVDAVADNTEDWERVLALCGEEVAVVEWDDRSACPIGVGCDSTGAFVVDPTSLSPHIAIAGRTGSGKSEFISALLSDWAERFAPGRLSWVGFDFKGGATLAPLARLSNCRGVETDLDPRAAERLWRVIGAEILRRESALMAESVARIEDSTSMSRLVVVIDEFPELVRLIPGAAETIGAIARRGRSLGMHLVISTQNASALSRDGLLANLTTRVCFPLGGTHDVTMFLGSPPMRQPRLGEPVIGLSDGSTRTIRVRHGASSGTLVPVCGERLPPLTGPPPTPPISGSDGFGLVDDPDAVNPTVARWSPEDGDVVVVGRRGSGRTTAIAALVRSMSATWIRSSREIAESRGVVVVDNLDSMLSGLTDIERFDLSAALESRRRTNPPVTFIMTTTQWLPRVHGAVRNVVTLSTNTRDEHLVTGEPVDTFDATAPPGVGSWKGKRVVIYASTESMVTDDSP